ncbi:hypothetical protein E4G67_01590 [Candidatus Bathyarchaeota archaeon]|nr:MAG: hypothetical protein E4G67_01590 [Candidatus Bathyarchaeota archaeon]
MQNNESQNGETLKSAVGRITEEQKKNFEDAVGDGIFTDDADAIEGMRQAAEALGINPDLVAPTDERVNYVAKQNCKHCYGRGAILFCLSPQKEKTFSRNEGLPGRVTNRNRSSRYKRKQYKNPVQLRNGPTQPRRKVVTGVSQANENTNSQWNTKRPEPDDFRKMNTTLSFCRCIRTIPV